MADENMETTVEESGSGIPNDIQVTHTGSSTIVEVGTGEGSTESSITKDDSEEGTNTTETEDEVSNEQTNPVEESTDLQTSITKHNEAVTKIGEELTKKGVDFTKVIEEYESSGVISDKTKEALAKAGYPAEVVDTFVQAQKVLETNYENTIYNFAGGKENFTKVTQWASKNLSNAEIASFNKAVDDGNLGIVKLILDGIQSKMVAKQGTSKPSILGGNAKTSNVTNQGFSTKSDMVKAMSDPRYGRDPIYTREVERKVIKSQF